MQDPLLGTWGRVEAPGAEPLTGLVTAVDGEAVTLFAPGERRMTTVPRAQVRPVPASAVHVRIDVDLPLPHGLGEDALRRWLASVVDPVLRERAGDALRGAGQDVGPALPEPGLTLTPTPVGDSGAEAVCLCGHRTPVVTPTPVACAACGRQAVPPPGT